MNVEKFAKEVHQNYFAMDGFGNEEGVSLDPITILMVAGLIINIIRLWKECKKDEEEVLESISNPSLFESVILRRLCRNEVGRKSAPCLYTAIKMSASKLTSNELASIYQEVPLED